MRRLFADVPRAQLVGDAPGQRCEQSHHWAEHAAPRGPCTRRLGGVMTALHALGGLPAAQVEDPPSTASWTAMTSSSVVPLAMPSTEVDSPMMTLLTAASTM